MFGTPFEIFGTVHLLTILSIVLVAIFLPKFYKNKSDEQISLMRKIGTVKKGDLVIITKGDLLGTSGGTNAMKVVEVGNMIEINE